MGGIVSGLFGASTPSAPNIQVWQPQYTGQADTQGYNSITGINQNNPYAANAGNYQGVLNANLNNPYAAPAQTAANTAGQQYASLGTQGAASGNALNQGAMSLLPYVSQIENTAMDPQSALYNRTFQQLQDQTGVSNAQNGLTGSPYGAGVANQANSNFNIDWQNNQLARQAQGLQAAGQGVQQAGQGASTAQNVGTGAAASTIAGGATPYAAYNNNLNNMQTALNNYGQSTVAGNTNTQTAVQDLLNYMTLGANQSNAQAKQTQTSYQDQLDAANAENQGLSSMFNNVFNPAANLLSSGGSSSTSASGAGGSPTSGIAAMLPFLMMLM